MTHQPDEGKAETRPLHENHPGSGRTRADMQQVERLLADQLIEGDAKPAVDPAAEAVRRLPPKWEIRIQTSYDPVAEETRVYRELAEEVDNRYDRNQTSRLSAKSAPGSSVSSAGNCSVDRNE